MARDNFIVRCPKCGAKNRIPPSRTDRHAVCGKCRTPLPAPAGFTEHPVDVSDRTFATEVLGFGGPAAVLFWAPWCGHCRRLLPVFDELASEFSGYVKFAKIELDRNPATATQYQIQSVPVLLLLKGGRIANRLVGAIPKYQLEYHLRALTENGRRGTEDRGRKTEDG